jgi:hypothetical protein
MIVRALAILLAVGAVWALWFGYGQLRLFRGTAFWDFRYIIFAVAAFFALSGLEWLMGRIKAKFEPDQDAH